MSHPVKRLNIHLPLQQSIIFTTDTMEQAAQQATNMILISRLQVNTLAAKIIRNSKILVIDKAGSTSKHVYTCVDRFLRDVRQNHNVPFGGIVVLLKGDFRQTFSSTIDGLSLIRIPDRLLVKNNIIHEIFGIYPLTLDYINTQNIAILCPTNKDSLEINELILTMF